MKLVPFSNIYWLMVLIGLSDVIGSTLFYKLVTAEVKFNQTRIQQYSFGLIFIFSTLLFSLLATFGEEEESYWYGLIVFLIRLISNITFNMSYL